MSLSGEKMEEEEQREENLKKFDQDHMFLHLLQGRIQNFDIKEAENPTRTKGGITSPFLQKWQTISKERYATVYFFLSFFG